MRRLVSWQFAFSSLLVFGIVSSGAAETVDVTIHGDRDGGEISRHIYGHFAEHLGRCIYDGIWVGPESTIPNTRGMRNDIVEALRELDIPNLRWPGGCFADDYHWKDGVGPRDERPKRINMHWGQVIDLNRFGTHEFLDLCEQLDCEPYIAGNVGSGTPEEMRDWIEYMTFDGDSKMANWRRANGRAEPWRVRYFGIGNENWGCGGEMRPEYYADLYRRFASFCRDYSGNRLMRVACGPGGYNRDWSRIVLRRAADRMQGFSLHFYTVWPNWQDKTPATGFGEREWFHMLKECLRIEGTIAETEELMDRYDENNRVELYVDEWGAWYRTESGHPGYSLYQQNSLRDAVLAGISFHILHDHNRRVKMANMAQTINVLQSMVLTKGRQMLLTPTYHLFEMYKVHHDSTRLPVDYDSPQYAFEGDSMPAVSIGASYDAAGKVHVSLVNAHAHNSFDVRCDLPGIQANSVTGRILTAEQLDAHNSFADPDRVKPAAFDDAELDGGRLNVELPARSVVVLELGNG